MENFENYKAYTKAADWKAICKLNGVSFNTFGVRKEFKALPKYLEPDEVVFAFAAGIMSQTKMSNPSDSGMNTWLVALTSDRFLFMDAALLTGSVDTQSIRHEHVQAVSASQGWILGKIMIDLGSRMVIVDNCNKASVKAMADLANKWQKELSEKQKENAGKSPSVESPLDKLQKLAKLHEMKALTDEEFNEAKKNILASL